MKKPSHPGGRYVQQPTGYRAFIPDDLPPDPPIDLGGETAALLARASMAVGRLDGVTQIVPNVDVFIAMYVRREAVDSSKIEGTQSSLQDVLAFELDPATRDLPRDVEDVVNYVRAMNYGLDRLTSFPLSLRLIREIHAELMQGVRGCPSARLPSCHLRCMRWSLRSTISRRFSITITACRCWCTARWRMCSSKPFTHSWTATGE